MKKLFTLLGIFLVTCASLAKAENVKIDVEVYATWDYSYEDRPTNYSYNTEITYADGVYTIDNFLKSGQPLSFTIGRGASALENSHTAISFVNNAKSEYATWGGINTTIVKTDDTNTSIGAKICDLGDFKKEIELTSPYIFNATSSTYVQRADKGKNGGNYFAVIRLVDDSYVNKDINAYGATYNLKFYFNGPQPEFTPVSVKMCDASGNEIAEQYKSELSVDTENIFTLSDFLASTQPMSFTFDVNDANDNIAITLKDNFKTIDVGGLMYNYILAPDGKPNADPEKIGTYQYLAGAKYFVVGNPIGKEISRPYITLEKSFIQRVDKAQNDGNNYKAHINVASSNGFDGYLEFYFAGPEQSSICDIAADDENAPVEFYNLNGQRVENPANGIFVRKQGSKLQKVVIR